MSTLFMLVAFLPVILLLFWTSRSQQKKQRDLESKLKKGDRILTQSGLVGRIVDLETRYVRLEIAPGVKVQMLKSSITGLETDGDGAKSKDESAASDKKT